MFYNPNLSLDLLNLPLPPIKVLLSMHHEPPPLKYKNIKTQLILPQALIRYYSGNTYV